MSVLIQIRNAHKSYGDQQLLRGAEASITAGAKIGFVGRNGSGKSTLLRIVLGEEELDSGEIIKQRNLRIGYLRQHDPFEPGDSALGFLMRDSNQPEWKCGEVAGKFEIKSSFLTGPITELSGGWQTRVKLAALLLHEPNLLLLDEPTNFLDLRTQILLEHFLKDFRAAVLVVSHDREFLKRSCDQTLDLTAGTLTMYPGKIDDFLTFQQERRQHDLRVNQSVVAKQKQLQQFIDKNRAGANTASQARSKQKQLDRLQTTEIAVNEATAHIRAPLVAPRKGTVLRCEGMEIGYPDHSVASDITLDIEHGQRVAVVGDNGQGKTTLLRSLVGSLERLAGKLKWGHASTIGTYAQHVYSSLQENRTVLEHLEYQAAPGTTHQEILSVAGALLFRESHVHKKISVLSGGERARLCMAGLLLGDYNILVLDEPGNHLDVETVDALATALVSYHGTVLFTSHDRHFMRQVATNVIEVRNRRARNYLGSYNAYLASITEEIAAGERQANHTSKKDRSPGKIPNDATKDAAPSQRTERKRQKEIRNLEKTISQLDGDKKTLNQQLLETTDAAEALQLHTACADLSEQLHAAEERWLQLNEES